LARLNVDADMLQLTTYHNQCYGWCQRKSCTQDQRSPDNEMIQESTLWSGGTPGTQRGYHWLSRMEWRAW
jgi:hypothetical protein